MAEFSVNVMRQDPYKATRFSVKWDGKEIPGIRSISALDWAAEVVRFRSGLSPNQVLLAPGTVTFAPLVLTRGRTHDTAFEDWAAFVWSRGGGVMLNEMRKDLIITLMNEAGQHVMAFKVFRAWPSNYQPLGALDSLNTSIAIESITLQYEGFERDTSLVEPKQP